MCEATITAMSQACECIAIAMQSSILVDAIGNSHHLSAWITYLNRLPREMLALQLRFAVENSKMDCLPFGQYKGSTQSTRPCKKSCNNTMTNIL